MNEWDEWRKEKGALVITGSGPTKYLRAMHDANGVYHGMCCEDCRYLERNRSGRRVFYKCVRVIVTTSRSPDWKPDWAACGLFVEKVGGYNNG